MDSVATGFRTEIGIAALVGVALALLLLTLRPGDRISTRNALFLVLICAATEFLAALSSRQEVSRAAEIAFYAAGFGMGIALIRLATLTLFRLLLPAVRVSTVKLVEDLVFAGLLLVWGFVWLSIVGVDLASLVTTSAVITGVIAFSMQDTLGNILGGIVLQLERSLTIGDWVKIDDIRGCVADVRWRYTAIETRDRETVYIPNSFLMKNRFMVLGSRNDSEMRWRRWVWFSVDIHVPPTEVCSVLVRALQDAEIDRVAKDPEPSAVLMDVMEGCSRYALRYFLTNAQADDPTDSVVRFHALAALERAGIGLAVRREERTLLTEDEARKDALAAEEHARRLAALDKVTLFKPLSETEKADVARHLVNAPFLKGDVVTRQGAVAHWLYLIISGEAEVVDDTDGMRTHVKVITAGKVFGERGMLTGEPRGATVIARTDLRCYRLDKAGFQGVIRGRPDIAEEFSDILSRREAELDALRLARSDEVSKESEKVDILARMRNFFGLG